MDKSSEGGRRDIVGFIKSCRGSLDAFSVGYSISAGNTSW